MTLAGSVPVPATIAGPEVRDAVYLYCFTHDLAGPRPRGLPPDLPAVDEDRSLQLHRHAGLIALVSAVRRADYEGEQGNAHLADIAWVGPRALRHQAVLVAAHRVAAVFPLPFGTLFSSRAALECEMERRQHEIDTALRRLAGCSEWAVQGTLDHAAALDARVREAIAEGRYVPSAMPGRRHLEEQRLRRGLEADLGDWARAAAASLAQALRRASTDFVERRVPTGQALAFNWAFLVPNPSVDAFQSTVTAALPELARYGLSVVCKGPWPGYSFTGPRA